MPSWPALAACQHILVLVQPFLYTALGPTASMQVTILEYRTRLQTSFTTTRCASNRVAIRSTWSCEDVVNARDGDTAIEKPYGKASAIGVIPRHDVTVIPSRFVMNAKAVKRSVDNRTVRDVQGTESLIHAESRLFLPVCTVWLLSAQHLMGTKAWSWSFANSQGSRPAIL